MQSVFKSMQSTDIQVDVKGVSTVLFTGNLLEILWSFLQSSLDPYHLDHFIVG